MSNEWEELVIKWLNENRLGANIYDKNPSELAESIESRHKELVIEELEKMKIPDGSGEPHDLTPLFQKLINSKIDIRIKELKKGEKQP